MYFIPFTTIKISLQTDCCSAKSRMQVLLSLFLTISVFKKILTRFILIFIQILYIFVNITAIVIYSRFVSNWKFLYLNLWTQNDKSILHRVKINKTQGKRCDHDDAREITAWELSPIWQPYSSDIFKMSPFNCIYTPELDY